MKTSLGCDFTAIQTRNRPDINDVIRRFDGFLIMFHHQHRVSSVTEFFQRFDQFEIVTLVQSDGGFIQYIQNSLQPCSQLGSKTDTLGFSAGKCCGRTVEIEVTDSDIVEETQTVPDFPENISANFFFPLIQVDGIKKTDGFFQ